MKDFKKVKFQDGMTNLKGALADASTIFKELDSNPTDHSARTKVNRAVMLFSDGEGNTKLDGNIDIFNGDNVAQQMLEIKTFRNIEVYAVGVTDRSNNDTLKNLIASDPGMYFYQPTFVSLKNLARLIRGGR